MNCIYTHNFGEFLLVSITILTMDMHIHAFIKLLSQNYTINKASWCFSPSILPTKQYYKLLSSRAKITATLLFYMHAGTFTNNHRILIVTIYIDLKSQVLTFSEMFIHAINTIGNIQVY